MDAEIDAAIRENGLTDRDTLVVLTFSDPEPGPSRS